MPDSAGPALAGRELFLRALRREKVPRPPVWFLRQSGRYLPEFRELRKRHKFEDLLREPELVAEATALPLRRFPLDCAILFSDITAPFLDLPLGLEFREGVGPVFTKVLPPAKLLDQLRAFPTPRRLEESVRAARREFPGKGFIGFAGAPYTLATYLLGSPVEEGRKRLHALASKDPGLARELLWKLGALAGEFLALQAKAGADALMLFDTWAGEAGAKTFEKLAAPGARIAANGAGGKPPVIYYTRGTSAVLGSLQKTGAGLYSVDDTVGIREVRAQLPRAGVQGNLDPSVFEMGEEEVQGAVGGLLSEAAGTCGFVLSTARGIEPGAKPDLVGKAVEIAVGWSYG